MKPKRYFINVILLSLLIFSSEFSLPRNNARDNKVISPKVTVVQEKATKSFSGLDVGKSD